MRTILFRILLAALFCGHLTALRADEPAPGAELFKQGPVLQIDLKLDERAINALRGNHREDVFGTLEEGGKVYQNVAFHLKGAAGSLRMIDDGKPAFTVSFIKKDKKQRFHGLRKIHLNNSVQDPVYIDEQFCGELFRAAGVPAARTAHAVVTLNGRRLGGLYVLKESFSDEFLSQYFTKLDGNLYDGGFLSDIEHPIEKSGGKGSDDHSDLRAVARAVRDPNAALRWKKLNEMVEVERFISMMALEAITVHWDGYSAKANNYRVYVNPENGKLVFFVHGMDQMFGRMNDLYAPIYPFMSGLIARSILSSKEGKALYDERLRQVFSRHFQLGDIQRMLARMTAPVEEELKKNPGRHERYKRDKDEHHRRVMERIRFVSEQLQKGRFLAPRFENGTALIDYWVAGSSFGDLIQCSMKQQNGAWQMAVAPGAGPLAIWRVRLQLEKGEYRLEGTTSPGAFAKGQGKVRVISAAKEIGASQGFGADPHKFSLEITVPNPRNEVELIAGSADPKAGVTYDLSSFRLTKVQ